MGSKTFNNVTLNVKWQKTTGDSRPNLFANKASDSNYVTENISSTLGNIVRYLDDLKAAAWCETEGTVANDAKLTTGAAVKAFVEGKGYLTEHPTITTTADTTSPTTGNTGIAYSGTFTAVTGVTRDSNGHVTTIETTNYQLPASDNTDEAVTQSISTADKNYPLLLSNYEKGATTTTAAGTNRVQTIYAHPSTGIVTANGFDMANSSKVNKLTSATLTADVTQTFPAKTGTVLNTGTTSYTATTASTDAGAYKIGTIKINDSSTDIYGLKTVHSALTVKAGTTSKVVFDATAAKTLVIDTGSANGNISVSDGTTATDVKVKGIDDAAFKKFDTTVTANSDNLITSGAVAAAISALPDAMVFKGTVGAQASSPTVTALVTDGTAKVGDTYKVITNGTYGGVAAKVGDTLVCTGKTANSNTWTLIPSGDDIEDTWRSIKVNGTEKLGSGTSTGNVDFVNGTNTTVTFNATGNKIAINASHHTVTTSADTTTPATGSTAIAHSGTFAAITGVTRDSNGHVTTVETTNYSLPAGYSHPTYTAQSSGFYKVTVDGTGHVSAVTNVTASDVKGLSGIDMTAATASAAGTHGMVPAPSAGDQAKYLRGDGTWGTPVDTKVNVTLATTTKAYLIGVSTAPTSTAQALTTVSDTGVYLDTTAGKLVATTFSGDLNGTINTATTATTQTSTDSSTKVATTAFVHNAALCEGDTLTLNCIPD